MRGEAPEVRMGSVAGYDQSKKEEGRVKRRRPGRGIPNPGLNGTIVNFAREKSSFILSSRCRSQPSL